MLAHWKEKCDKPRYHIKKQRHYFVDKCLYCQSYFFFAVINMDVIAGWWRRLKNWCFQIVLPEKTLKSPLDCKEIKPVNLIGNQPRLSIGKTDAESPILWPSDSKSQLLGKDSDSGEDWRQNEKEVAEDEMVT